MDPAHLGLRPTSWAIVQEGVWACWTPPRQGFPLFDTHHPGLGCQDLVEA